MKIPIKDILWNLLRVRCQTAGNGRIKITKSVTVFRVDPIIKKSQESIQVPLILLSHASATGLHWNIITSMTMMDQQTVKVPRQ